jgi:hypothetical protein
MSADPLGFGAIVGLIDFHGGKSLLQGFCPLHKIKLKSLM